MAVLSSAASDVLDRLLVAHEAYFDVERAHEFAGMYFDGYAAMHANNSQYVLVKRAKLWEASSHEYMFFKIVEHLDAPTFDKLVEFMKTSALDKVVLEQNHMNSFLTLVVIATSMDSSLERRIRTIRFRKNFMFGLKGWSDLRLCVIDLAARRVHANAMGKELVPTLAANAFGE